MKKLIIVFLFLLAVPAVAQTTYVKSICFTDGTGAPTNNCFTANGFTKINSTGALTPLGPFDASAGTVVIPWTVGLLSARPSCTRDGQVYFATDVFLGQNVYMCVATVWQQMRINNQVLNNQSNTYTAGQKQIFQTNATTAGLRLACVTADPSTPAAGDLWCRSDTKLVKFYDGTAVQSIALVGAFVPTGVDANSSGQVTGLHLPTTRSGDVIYYNGTAWTELAGNNAGGANTIWPLMEGPTGVPVWSTNLSENTNTNTLNYAGGGGINATTTVSAGGGDPSCGSATGCFGATEASTTGSGLAGHDYIRANSSTHQFAISTNGGPENLVPQSTNTGVAGQPLLSNGDGTYTASDPLVSFNPPVIFPAGTSATGTATSNFFRLPTLATGGSLILTFASITGSPSCTLQMRVADSAGNFVNNGSAIAITPANGTSIINFTNTATISSGSQVGAVYSCSTYPLTGTMTMEQAPSLTVTIQQSTGSSVNTNISSVGGTAVNSAGGTQGVSVVTGGSMPNAMDVKAASTQAAVTDRGAVVQISPNSPGTLFVPCNILTTASTNSTNCSNAAANLYGYDIYNTTTTVYYLRLYNSGVAPTCSSATGFVRSIPLVPGASSGLVGGQISNQTGGVNYSTGIGYCITGGSSSTDNTNAAAGIFGEIRFK